MKTSYIKLLLLCYTCSCLLLSCDRAEYRTEEGVAWHTAYHITYRSDRDLTPGVLAVINMVDSVLSPFNPTSAVSLLNAADSIEAPKELLEVFAKAQEINRLTGGLFDPSAAPLINAYGFGYKNGTPPDSSAVQEILAYVGMQKATIIGRHIMKHDRRTEYNFSALAKGYGCDLVARYLHEQGSTDFMVEIGGEIVLRGLSPSGDKWRIAVDRPDENLAPGQNPQMVLSLTDCALATSGNYRNFKQQGANKIGHIVNPLTGFPAQTDIASATVIATTCMEADALATSLMTMTRRQSEEFCRINSITALLIMKDGAIFMTPSMQKLVDL